MKVWIPHPVKENLELARPWGVLTYINHRYIYPDELSERGELPPGFLKNMNEAVHEFDPETDCFMLVGDLVQICAISGMLACAYPRFHILRYDRQANGYVRLRMPEFSPAPRRSIEIVGNRRAV